MSVVYVHASGGSGRQWRRWTPLMPGLCPDLAGSDHVQDVVQIRSLVEAHGPVDLIGHSYGGSVALYAALQVPHAVRSVTVYEAPLLGLLTTGTDADRALLAGSIPPLLVDSALAGTEPWLAAFVDWWSGVGAWTALADAVRAEFLAVGPRVAAEVAGLMGDARSLSDYAALPCPILVLRGDRTPPAVARALHRLAELPQVRLDVLADAGHFLPVTAPERLIPLVRAFLAGG